MEMYVIKFTLTDGRSHYGHSDYIAFETEELANTWIEYDSIKHPELKYSIEKAKIPIDIAQKKRKTYNEEAKVLLERYKAERSKYGKRTECKGNDSGCR